MIGAVAPFTVTEVLESDVPSVPVDGIVAATNVGGPRLVPVRVMASPGAMGPVRVLAELITFAGTGGAAARLPKRPCCSPPGPAVK